MVAKFWAVHLRTAQKWLAATPPVPVGDSAAMLAWFASFPSASQNKFARSFRRRVSELRIYAERHPGAPLPSLAVPESPAEIAAARPSPNPHAPTSSLPHHAQPPHATPHPTPPLAQTPPTPSPASPFSSSPTPPTSTTPLPGLVPLAAPSPLDPDYATFLQSHPAPPPDATNVIPSLRHRRAFADHKLGLAQSRGDLSGIKDATDALKLISSVLYDEETLASRLGREAGDTLPRPAAEALIAAFAYWALRAIDGHLDHLSRRLINLSYPEEARALLEPELLSARFLVPFARAAATPARNTLPPWLIARLRDTVDDYLDHGAAHFDHLFNDHAQVNANAIPSPSSSENEQPSNNS
jgi:hypothetical protein